LAELEFELRALHLVGILYCLSHTSSPFWSGYFRKRADFCPCWPGPPKLGRQACTATASFILSRWCLANFFAWSDLKPWSSQA
jgi:hypothetical protein